MSRHILLAERHGETGIQINIFSNNISLEVPFTGAAIMAEHLIDLALVYIGIICKHTGYLAYNSQTGKVYDRASSCFDGLKTYYDDSHAHLHH